MSTTIVTPEAGLYGPRGWTVESGIWPLLARCHDSLRTAAETGDTIDVHGAPVDEYVPFHDMGPEEAAFLLEVLPAVALEDRQNLAPTLGALLRACASFGGAVRLSGYGIGPQRHDERVTVEALWVADRDLLLLKAHRSHDSQCQCVEIWRRVRERYDLGTDPMPDEVRHCAQRRDGGPVGTWMWWD